MPETAGTPSSTGTILVGRNVRQGIPLFQRGEDVKVFLQKDVITAQGFENMAHTEKTIALDENWDLSFDGNGNLKFLTGADAIAQNVCNECRRFLRDSYFYQGVGIDWFTDQLGQPLQISVMTDRLRKAALRVDGVLAVTSIELEEVDQETRTLHGTIKIETEYGIGTSRI